VKNSVGQSGSNTAATNNYWGAPDQFPSITLYPSNTSRINTSELDVGRNILYVGGTFSKIFQNNAKYHSIYDISSSTFKIYSKNYGTNGTINAYALDSSNNILYVGGNFTRVTDNFGITTTANNIAGWNLKTQRWITFGNSGNSTGINTNGFNGICNAIAIDQSNQEVYVGGGFTNVNFIRNTFIDYGTYPFPKLLFFINFDASNVINSTTVSTNYGNITLFNGASIVKNTQKRVGDSELLLNSALNQYTSIPFITGGATGVSAWPDKDGFSISFWFRSNNSQNNAPIYELGNGPSNAVISSYIFNNALGCSIYGNWTDFSNTLVPNVNNNVWYHCVWTVTNLNPAQALTINGASASLWKIYINGSLTTTYNAGAYPPGINFNRGSNFIGRSNTVAYPYFNGGVDELYFYGIVLSDAEVRNMYLLSSLADINTPANYIIKWNIPNKQWIQLGSVVQNGLDGSCNVIEYDNVNNKMYVGGKFNRVSDASFVVQSANNIAIWDIRTSRWSQFGGPTFATNGLTNTCRDIAYDSCYNVVYVGGDFTSVKDNRGIDFSLNYIAMWNIATQKWEGLGPNVSNGTNGIIFAYEYDNVNKQIYCAGNFTQVFDTSNIATNVRYIASWDVIRKIWKPLGIGPNNGTSAICRTLAYDNVYNRLYVGGDFVTSRDSRGIDLSVNSIAIWDVSKQLWNSTGSMSTNPLNGTNGQVNTYAYDSCKNILYAGGTFTQAYDGSNVILNVRNIAAWDIKNKVWTRLGSSLYNGVDASCNALAMDSANQILYVGGTFKTVSDASNLDISANFLATWNAVTNRWSNIQNVQPSVAGVGLNDLCYALQLYNNRLYVGGNFRKFIYFNDMSSNVNSNAYYGYSFDPSNVYGSFVESTITSTNSVVNGTATLVGGATVTTSDFAVPSGSLLIDSSNLQYLSLPQIPGATFTTTTGLSISVWFKMNTNPPNNRTFIFDLGVGTTSNNNIALYAADTSNGILTFRTWLNASTSNIFNYAGVNFNDNTWHHIVWTFTYVSASITTWNIYVDGSLAITQNVTNFPLTAARTACYLGTSAWHVAGQAGYNNYRGGIDEFYIFPRILNATDARMLYTQKVSPNSALMNYVGIFDIPTKKWSPLGGISLLNNGVNALCRTITYDNSNNKVYVGGDFTTASDRRQIDLSINYIASFDPSTNLWNAFGEYINNGTNGQINTYAYDSCKNIVYCGGTFTQVYDVSNIVTYANNLAAWDITNRVWNTIGVTTSTTAVVRNGLDSNCNALALDSVNQILYVGGNFRRVSDLSAADQSANYVAAWNINTQRWRRMGSIAVNDSSKNGLNALCRTIVYDSNNKYVYVGGDFTQTTDARGSFAMNYVAIWNTNTNLWSNAFGSYGTSGISSGTNGTINTFAIDNSNQLLYVGGSFTIVYDAVNISSIVNNVAIWNINGKYWSRFGSSQFNGPTGTVYTMTIDMSNQVLYVGGQFYSVKDASNNTIGANCIVSWNINTQSWQVLGVNQSNGVFRYYTDGNSNFQITTNDGSQWVRTTVLDVSNQVLYVGGNFPFLADASYTIPANGTPIAGYSPRYANSLVSWNIPLKRWIRVGNNGAVEGDYATGIIGTVYSMALDTSNCILYFGGYFTEGSDAVNWRYAMLSVGKWNILTNTFVRMGIDLYRNGLFLNNSFFAQVYTIVLDMSNELLYIGGFGVNFAINPGYASGAPESETPTYDGAVWNNRTGYFSSLGPGPTSSVGGFAINTMNLDASNQKLYVGGTFSNYGPGLSRINLINGQWEYFASVNNAVNVIITDNSNNLYVGGAFNNVRIDVLQTSSISFGVNSWVSKNTPYTRNWLSVAMSSTGQYQIATRQDGMLYLSMNSGNTWSEMVDTSRNWSGIAMSSNGQYVSTVSLPGRIYISNNMGKTFTEKLSDASRAWKGISMSADGQYQSAVVSSGLIYASSDYGNNWITTDISRAWNCIGMSSTGQYQTACETGGRIYVSSNYGSTWSSKDASRSWQSVALSSTGQYQTAVATSLSFIYISTDTGNTWSQKGIQKNWQSVALSSTGQYQVACAYGDYVYISADSGNTWIQKDSIRNWQGVSISADGAYSTAVVYGGFIYTNISIVPAYSLQDSCANSILYYDKTALRSVPVGAIVQNGLDASCSVMLYDSSNNSVYVGGAFRKVSDSAIKDQNANYVAIWNNNTNRWDDFGTDASNGLNNFCNALAYDSSNQVVYVGGNFTRIRDVQTDQSANYLAAWNLNTKRWSKITSATSVGDGLNGPCNSLAFDSSNGNLYIGGNFGQMGEYIRYDFNSTGPNVPNSILNSDVSGNLTLGGSAVSGSTGLAGFIGSGHYSSTNTANSYGTMPSLPSDIFSINNGGFTISFWFNTPTIGTAKNFFYLGNGASDFITAYTVAAGNNDQVYVTIKNVGRTAVTISASSTFIANTWQLCSIVFRYVDPSNTNIDVYINTTKTNSNIANFPDTIVRTQNFIGFAPATSGFQQSQIFSGGIDQFAIYKRPLTESQINYLVNRGTISNFFNYDFYNIKNVAYLNVPQNKIFPLGSSQYNGVYGTCNTIVLTDTNVFIGGNFTNNNDVSANDFYMNNNAIWNKNTGVWSNMGATTIKNGLNASCYGMAIDNSNQQLYIVGNFTRSNDYFSTKSMSYISEWSFLRRRWEYIVGGISGAHLPMYGVMYDASNSLLYAVGSAYFPYDIYNVRFASYWSYKFLIADIKNNTWVPLGNNTATTYGFGTGTTTNLTYALEMDASKNVYIGGSYVATTDDLAANRLVNNNAVWIRSSSIILPFGDINQNGTDGACNILLLDVSNQRLYVGGTFRNVRDSSNILKSSNFIGSWNTLTQRWNALGADASNGNGLNAQCRALTIDQSNQILYIGGDFTRVSDISRIDQSTNYVARWNVNSQRWGQLGGTSTTNNGLDASCTSLFYFSNNRKLYVGGNFKRARDLRSIDISINNIASWNTIINQWEGFGNVAGNGTNGVIYAYTYDYFHNVIYVGGSFTQVYDSSNLLLNANNVAKWDLITKSWGLLGTNDPSRNGVNAICRTLVYDFNNDKIYVGGDFTRVNDGFKIDQSANYVATWNIGNSFWSFFGTSDPSRNGTTGICRTLVLDSSNSTVYVGGDFTTVTNSKGQSLPIKYIASWNLKTNQWGGFGGYVQNGTNGAITTYVYDSCKNIIYCGGSFTQVYDTSNIQLTANRIAAWNINGQFWSMLGTSATFNGLGNTCNALAIDSSRQILYVGGLFTTASSSASNNITPQYVAIWNNNTRLWTQMGGAASGSNGLNNTCNALALDASNQILYVGGAFTAARDGIQANRTSNYIAAWNINTSLWSVFGTNTATTNGLNATCRTLVYDSSNTKLYVGGDFTSVYLNNASTFSMNYVVAWNTIKNSWEGLGTYTQDGIGLTIGNMSAVTLDNSNNVLYIGLNIQGGSTVFLYDSSNIVTSTTIPMIAWNITNKFWSVFTGTGITSYTHVTSLVFDSSNQTLYASTEMVSAGSRPSGIFSVNVSSYANNWTPQYTLEVVQDGSFFKMEFVPSSNVLYVGGQFVLPNTVTAKLPLAATRARNIAAWNITTQQWSRLGSDSSYNGTNSRVHAMKYDNSNNVLYVGGTFTNFYDTSPTFIFARYIGYWDISANNWKNLLGTRTTNDDAGIYLNAGNAVYAFELNQNILYVGGDFTSLYDPSVGRTYAAYVGRWNTSTKRWSSLGGSSTTSGVNQIVNAILYDNSNNLLYVGGNFTATTDDASANKPITGIAQWNPSTNRWLNIGTNVNANVNVTNIVLHTATNNLYVGGTFRQVRDAIGDMSANLIASLDLGTKYWSKLGASGRDPNAIQNGTDNSVYTIALDSSNQKLYVGGTFTVIRDISNSSIDALRVAAWNLNISRWERLGIINRNGVSGAVNAIVIDSSNSFVYVGGNYTFTYDASNFSFPNYYITRWNTLTSRFSTLGTGARVGLWNAPVNALSFDGCGNLFVGGTFTQAYDASSNGLSVANGVIWNEILQRWVRIGGTINNNGTNGAVYSILYDGSNQMIHVGGNFTLTYFNDISSTSFSSNYISYWTLNNNQWNRYGTAASNGTNNIVNSIAKDNQTNRLYIGGNFTAVSDSTAATMQMNYVAGWDISNNIWLALGNKSTAFNGTNGICYTVFIDNVRRLLFVGGAFTTSSDSRLLTQSTNGIAVWNLNTNIFTQTGANLSSNNGITGGTPICFAFVQDGANLLYVGGQFTTVNDVVSNRTARNIAIWNNTVQRWILTGTNIQNGLNGVVNTIIYYKEGNVLYMGGNFTRTNDSINANLLSNNITTWDLSLNVWNPVGVNLASQNGITAQCNTLKIDTLNNDLYVGGAFLNVNDGKNTSANYTAVWNLTNSYWYQQGSTSSNGLNSSPYSISNDNITNKLYVAGNFTTANDITFITKNVNYICYWDKTKQNWFGMGNVSTNGTNGQINAYAYDNINNVIYCAGNFSKVYDASSIETNVNNIAAWNISSQTWSRLGSLTYNGVDASCTALALYDNVLYVGGYFLNVFDSSNEILTNTNYIAGWNINTKTWSRLGSLLSNGLNSFCVTMRNVGNDLYVGGNFTIVYDAVNFTQSANYIAKWDTNNKRWSQLGGSGTNANGLSSICRTIGYDSVYNRVFVGGDFVTAKDDRAIDISVNYVASWELELARWRGLGGYSRNGTNGVINSYVYDSLNNLIHVAGNFTQVYDETNIILNANYVATWNINANSWILMGSTSYNGTNAQCRGIAYDNSNQNIFVGGDFTAVYDSSNTVLTTTNYVGIFSYVTKTWSRLGSQTSNGLNAYSNSLAYDTSNQVLYVGGNFTTVSDVSNVGLSANYVARWNLITNRWSPLGSTTSNGLSALCRTLVYDLSNQDIYVGGDFTTVRDSRNYSGATTFAIPYAAIWNIQRNNWEGFGNYALNGLTGPTAPEVYAYVYDSCKNIVYCGGKFITAYDQSNIQMSANNVVGWDVANRSWFALGGNTTTSNGVNDYVSALSIDSSKQILYVGGNFTRASDTSNVDLSTNRVAAWNINTQRWNQLGGSLPTNNGLGGLCSALLYDNSNNFLYAGGTFTTASDISNTSLSATNVAIWNINTSRWNQFKTSQQSGLNNGLVSTQIFSFVIDSSNNYLYVGGYNANPQGTTFSSHIIALNRNTNLWESVGVNGSSQQGTNWIVRQMILDTSNSFLYVCGGFDQVYDATNSMLRANNIAYWDIINKRWNVLGLDISNGLYPSPYLSQCIALDTSNNILYVGSVTTPNVTDASGVTTINRLAGWNVLTKRWFALGTVTQNGLSERPYAFALDLNRNLYVGGSYDRSFDASGTLFTSLVSIWNPAIQRWSRMGMSAAISNGTNQSVYAFALDNDNQIVYTCGNFTNVYDSCYNLVNLLSAKYVASFDLRQRSWSALGVGANNGTNAVAYSLAYDKFANDLYIGGNFTTVSSNASRIDQSANYVAYWDATLKTWFPLGSTTNNLLNGLSAACNTLVLDGGGNLYTGGLFTTVRDATTTISGISSVYNAKWTPSTNTWSRFGSILQGGLNGPVYSLAYDNINEVLYTGGAFTTANDVSNVNISTRYIALWNNQTLRWNPLGTPTINGLDSSCISMVLDDRNLNNRVLYVGGTFKRVSDASFTDQSANGVAFWNVSTQRWGKLGLSTPSDILFNGIDGSCIAMVLDTSNNDLYVGGRFTNVRDNLRPTIAANNGAIWDISTSKWQLMGTLVQNGFDASCLSITFDTNKGILYAGGNFTISRDSSNSQLNTYFISTWNPITNRWTQLGYNPNSTTMTYGTNKPVRFMSYDSKTNALYISGDFIGVADASNVATDASNIAYLDSNINKWYPLGTSVFNGTSDSVNDITIDYNNNIIYVDGSFINVYDSSNLSLTANYVASWNPSTNTWSKLGPNGLSGMGNSIFYDNMNNLLYVGGNFTRTSNFGVPDICSNFVAEWIPSMNKWTSLGGSAGNGTNRVIYSYAYDAANQIIYCGGNFTEVYDNSNGRLNANYVAAWNINRNAWSLLGTPSFNGTDSSCNIVLYDSNNKRVYVGGEFRNVYDGVNTVVNANYIAYYNPLTNTWVRMGNATQNGLNGICDAMTYDNRLNELYVGGFFRTVNDIYGANQTANYVVKWNTRYGRWYQLGNPDPSRNGVDGICRVMLYNAASRVVYVGGDFLNSYSSSGTVSSARYIASWNTTTNVWSPFGSAASNGLNAYCSSLVHDGISNRLYVGGNFTRVSDASLTDQSANYIVTWNFSTNKWNQFGGTAATTNGTNGLVTAITLDSNRRQLYVSGNFTIVRDVSNAIESAYIAKWNIQTSRWSTIANNRFDASNGTNGEIRAYVYDSCRNVVYCGGRFTQVRDTTNGDSSANNIAVWDVSGRFWSLLGTPLLNGTLTNTFVNTLAMDSSNQILYVGGEFTSVTDSSNSTLSNTNYIAAWNARNRSWSRIGASSANNGTNARVNALVFSNNRLYVGGDFTHVSFTGTIGTSVQSRSVSIWNTITNAWSVLGVSGTQNGTDGSCNSLALDTVKNKLYVGGLFNNVSDSRGVNILNGINIASWDLSKNIWEGFGSFYNNGTNGIINSMAYDSCKNIVYCGGQFTLVYDASNIQLTANNIAAWNINGSFWSLLGTTSSNGTNNIVNSLDIDTANQFLYVGGTITTGNDSRGTIGSLNLVAGFDITKRIWIPLGSGITIGTTVNSIVYDGSKNNLYVGGSFTRATDISLVDCSNIAGFNLNTNKWFRFGVTGTNSNGTNAAINVMVLDRPRNQLYVGGTFTTIYDSRKIAITANRVA
jgi:hypothetical protein